MMTDVVGRLLDPQRFSPRNPIRVARSRQGAAWGLVTAKSHQAVIVWQEPGDIHVGQGLYLCYKYIYILIAIVWTKAYIRNSWAYTKSPTQIREILQFLYIVSKTSFFFFFFFFYCLSLS